MVQTQRTNTHHKKKSRVLVVDDHPIVRQGLANLIDHEDDLIVCGEAENAAQALDALARLTPDVVIVDITLKSSNGIELTRIIRQQHPQLPVIVLSMHDESVYAERALRAGAQAYLMKEVVAEKVVTAIRKVLRGEVYLSDKITRNFLRKLSEKKTGLSDTPAERLSNREFEVFTLIGQGYKPSKIAACMNLSIKTFETYRARIKIKLNLADAEELLQYAIKWVNITDRQK